MRLDAGLRGRDVGCIADRIDRIEALDLQRFLVGDDELDEVKDPRRLVRDVGADERRADNRQVVGERVALDRGHRLPLTIDVVDIEEGHHLDAAFLNQRLDDFVDRLGGIGARVRREEDQTALLPQAPLAQQAVDQQDAFDRRRWAHADRPGLSERDGAALKGVDRPPQLPRLGEAAEIVAEPLVDLLQSGNLAGGGVRAGRKEKHIASIARATFS